MPCDATETLVRHWLLCSEWVPPFRSRYFGECARLLSALRFVYQEEMDMRERSIHDEQAASRATL
jgi:hypothetical protein